MHVRDKVLALIGSWYEAFGAAQGRYPQYIMAYEDLRVHLQLSLLICTVVVLYHL